MTSSPSTLDALERNIELLHKNTERDSEAVRHTQIIVPMLTDCLGWELSDLLPEKYIAIPNAAQESHVFRNASIRQGARPDIVISPIGLPSIAVVENKERQPSVESLNNFRMQVTEYQALYECVWGVLTDGEIWIVKRNFENYLTFNSFAELRQQFPALLECLGKQQVISRYEKYGSTDLILIGTLPPFPVLDSSPKIINLSKSTKNGVLVAVIPDLPIDSPYTCFRVDGPYGIEVYNLGQDIYELRVGLESLEQLEGKHEIVVIVDEYKKGIRTPHRFTVEVS